MRPLEGDSFPLKMMEALDMSGTWLDTQLSISTKIPNDLDQTGVVGEQTLLYEPLRSIDRRTNKDLDNNDALIRILKNLEVNLSLKTIENTFFLLF